MFGRKKKARGDKAKRKPARQDKPRDIFVLWRGRRRQ
jgi:hypothetical protein